MSSARRLLLVCFGLLATACAAMAQDQAESRYVYAPERSIDGGTGMFYMGRETSGVMGHLAAEWLERPTRTHEEMPDEVVENMNLRPTDVVADIGAGSGYFTFRIAAKVPQGKVLAVDIQPEMLAMVEARRLNENVSNVEGVLGDLQTTNLPPDSVDVAFLVDAYHEFSHPYEMMQSIYTALKPGGRLILVEYRGEDRSVPIRPLHKMTQAQVKREMAVFDLQFEETLDFLPWQHMMIFSKR